jgi:hypothetical protein
VQQHLTLPVVLAGPDIEHPVLQVDVRAIQAERFTQPQTGAGQQPDEGLEGGRGQWPRQRSRGDHQLADLLRGIDVRGCAWLVRA